MNIVKEIIELKNLYNKLLCKFGNTLTVEQDPTVPSHVKNITEEDISNWNNIEDIEVQITETTNFAEVGQNQKNFNKNVANTVSNQGNEINILKGINFEMDIPNQKLILRNGNSVILTEISVAFLNDEAKHLEYDGAGSLVLKNEQDEVLSTLSVASFINQIGKSLNLDGYQLELLDENNNTLSTVTFEISSILGLENALEFINNKITNLQNINYTWSPTNRTLTLFDGAGNQLSQVSLVSLDNEGTDIRYNASTLSLELYNADNELLDSIPVSSFIGSVGTQLQLNSNQLQLKDSQGNILSTVTFAVSNIQGLQTALDTKLTVPIMTNNYYGLWDDINKKFITGSIYKNGSNTYISDKLYTPNGVNTKDLSFTLQTSITPTPNTLVPKTDGSGLIWYNNSSVDRDIALYLSPTNNYVGRWNNGAFVNGILQDNGTRLMFGAGSFPPSNPNRDRDTLASFSFPSGFNIPFHFGTAEYGSVEPAGIQVGDFWVGNQNIYLNIGGWGVGGLSRKLIGLEISKNGFSNSTWNFDTINNDFFNGTSLICTGNYNGQLLSSNTSNVGIDNRMFQGALYTIKSAQGNSFTVQHYFDFKGNIFTRGLGAGAETDWKKAVMERTGYNTTLVEKLALSRVKLKSYTKSERNALTNKEVGEMIWQTDSGNSGIRVYDGTNWLALQTTID